MQKADDSYRLQNLKKNFIQAISYSEFKDWRANSVDHNEPPHQDLRCLQIYLFSSYALKEFNGMAVLEKLAKIKLNFWGLNLHSMIETWAQSVNKNTRLYHVNLNK